MQSVLVLARCWQEHLSHKQEARNRVMCAMYAIQKGHFCYVRIHVLLMMLMGKVTHHSCRSVSGLGGTMKDAH